SLTSEGFNDVFILKLSPTGSLVWAKRVGGTGYEYSYTISVDSNGNVYTAGRFEDTVDFDPGTGTNYLTSAGGSDMFILKLDSSGNFIWAVSMGGTGTDQINAIELDFNGNIYASGVFNDTANFHPGAGTYNLISQGLEDFFILKLNSAGVLEWAHGFGSTGNDRSYSITTDASGNVYATGVFSGTLDFDPGAGIYNLTSAGNFDIYIVKMKTNGDFIWARNMGGTSFDFGYDITTDQFGNIYTTGYFQGTAGFDPGAGSFNLTSQGNYDIFIHKMDTAGNFIWARSMGGLNEDRGYSIVTDHLGDVYLTGYFIGDVDFDHSNDTLIHTAAGNADFYIHKTDSAGNFLWVSTMGGANHDFGLSIAIDAAGNIYSTGNFEGTADFNPDPSVTYNLTPAGNSDVFVLKLRQCSFFINNTATVSGSTITADLSGATYQWLDCNNNFQIIPGETNQSFTPVASGMFAVEITDNVCVDTTTCYFINVVSLNENNSSLQLTIYPNPAISQTTINFDDIQESVRIYLFTSDGRMLLSEEYFDNKDIKLDVHELPSGIYLLKIETKEGVWIRKIIKK
ncbi:MAG: SBBP repeat-containing protein, partial [Bacteroidia bacterium]